MRTNKERAVFGAIGYSYLLLAALLCVLPLLFIAGGSLSSETDVVHSGFALIPKTWSLEAYRVIFRNPHDIANAYLISALVVLIGTAAGLFITAMTGYVLSRRDFRYRNALSFFFYFTSVFTGGLVPWYIMMVSYLHMKDNFLALILPLLLNVFYLIIMKTFMAGIPFEVIESAKADGANEFVLFLRIILPLAKPALATIGLYIALGYWNDFFSAMLFISSENLLPLQYYLYRMINAVDALNRVAAMTGIPVMEMPKETLKLAMTMLVVLPVICLYPFVQRFMVDGVTLGAVKG